MKGNRTVFRPLPKKLPKKAEVGSRFVMRIFNPETKAEEEKIFEVVDKKEIPPEEGSPGATLIVCREVTE